MVSSKCDGEELVGRRVAVGEDLGTVRYVGPVASAKGTWLGIEWDDPARGKHNGSYDGHTYFETRYPTAGSFIHLEKADFGRSCVSAIQERYGSNQPTLTADELKNLQKAMNSPFLEFVGFDKLSVKISCFSDLDVISLHNHQVSSAGEELASLNLKASDVDLSNNLLSSWDQVAEIIVHMPEATFINLSVNKLTIPDKPESLSDVFRKLSGLVMAQMDYSWEQILRCSEMWPQINELHVPFNNITSLSQPERTLTDLVQLVLEGNSISDWEEINKLGALEKLESLNLCGLGLTSISLPASKQLFKNLQLLMLSENKISQWESVSQLTRLQKLKELKFSQNPILDNLTMEEIHVNVMGRIESLEVLNRRTYSETEKKNAELEYIHGLKDEWLRIRTNEELNSKFLSNHLRFESLCKKYGILEVGEELEDVRSNESYLVKVTLMTKNETIVKELPKSMKINTLYPYLRKLFPDCPTLPTLFHRRPSFPRLNEHLKSFVKTLDFYGIEDDDVIFIQW